MSTTRRCLRSAERFAVALVASAVCTGVGHATTVEEDMAWTGGLRNAYFADRDIQTDDLITLEAPKRADNAAIVPISVKAGIPQTEARYIRTIYLFVDKNPGPLVGTFRFTPASGRADLGLRLRINAYSPVRAIAETNDGSLHMSRRFVKASGGCSAPASSDPDAAEQGLGQMKFMITGNAEQSQPTPAQLLIRHPNRSGLQMDQVSHLYSPAEYIKQVKVSFEGEEIFHAETGFAVSENPSFRFYFVPPHDGQLTAEVSDTEGRRFSESFPVSPVAGKAASGD